MIRTLGEFGMSLALRARVASVKDTSEDDPFENF